MQSDLKLFVVSSSCFAGKRRGYSRHSRGAGAPDLRQHSQYESEECEKVRAVSFDFPVLAWLLALISQPGHSGTIWGSIFIRATKIRVKPSK